MPKKESQDIFFIGKGGVTEFLRREIPDAFQAGVIRHVNGTELGRHNGLAAYTLGQRKGLGVAWSEPLYVVAFDHASNTVVLGAREDLLIERMTLRDCTWHLQPPPSSGMACLVRNRYRARPVAARISPLPDGGATVCYEVGQTCPSPGQACVVYDQADAICLGGGWFCAQDVTITEGHL